MGKKETEKEKRYWWTHAKDGKQHGVFAMTREWNLEGGITGEGRWVGHGKGRRVAITETRPVLCPGRLLTPTTR